MQICRMLPHLVLLNIALIVLLWHICFIVLQCYKEKDSTAEMLQESQLEVERLEKQQQVKTSISFVYFKYNCNWYIIAL